MAARKLKLVDTRRGVIDSATPGGMILTEYRCDTTPRWRAQQTRASLIREDLASEDTYVSRVIRADGVPVWRVVMPL